MKRGGSHDLVSELVSRPWSREENRALRRLLGRAALAALVLLFFLLVLNVVAAAAGYGSF